MSRAATVLLFLFVPSCTGAVQDPVDVPVQGAEAIVCTELQGSVSTITRGTYCVTGDVIIPTGVTLDIPAGTTFIVKGRFRFGRDATVPDFEPPTIAGSGTIRAIGTAEAPIIFRGETPTTAWYGLTISHAHAPVHLEYVTISDTYKDDRTQNVRLWRRGGALNSYVNKKGTIIRHCTFTNNRALSVGGAVEIYSHGWWPDEAPVEITDSRFEGNSCECDLYRPSPNDLCGGGAIRLTEISGDSTLVKIQGNVFRNNQARRTVDVDSFGGAIGGTQTGVVVGPGNVFEGNRGDPGDGAISCNRLPMLGSIISEVDPSVVFTTNQPDNGCGR